MKCACGFQQQTGKPRIDIVANNKHRATCPEFWKDVYADMRRIAIEHFGGFSPIAAEMWDKHRRPDLPTHDAMKKWNPPVRWAQVQEAAGMGVSLRGKGAIAQRGGQALGVSASNNRLDEIALSIHPVSVSAESYMAQTSREGLLICEQSYLKTGRMWLR